MNFDDEVEVEEERNFFLLFGYLFFLVLEISELDYIYGFIVIGLFFLFIIIIVLVFMRKFMRFFIIIILIGIVVLDILKLFL